MRSALSIRRSADCRSCVDWVATPVRWFVAAILFGAMADASVLADSWTEAIEQVQPKMAKIYGAGGIRQLESYQSGFLFSPNGHVLTAWSYVLDTDEIIVTLFDGSRFDAEIVGADPSLELAVLKIDADGLQHFDLSLAPNLEAGDRVMAFSNLFGIATGNEPVSVLHGQVLAVTQLDARRGSFNTPYRGDVYLVDAITNNAGAAGGALTNLSGELAAVQGKELRDAHSGIWLNYAIPVSQLRESVQRILSGESAPRREDQITSRPALVPWDMKQLGFWMIPDVLTNTPPFVQGVTRDSPAEKAGLQPDDLVVYANGHLVRAQSALAIEIELVENDEPLVLTVMRGQEITNMTVQPPTE